MRRIPDIFVRRIEEAIEMLREDPFPTGSIKLRTATGCHYRIRVGSYRVIYEVAHEIRIVIITRVGHRGRVY